MKKLLIVSLLSIFSLPVFASDWGAGRLFPFRGVVSSTGFAG